MAVQRDNPYGNSNFTVEIGGIDNISFERIYLPQSSVEVTEYREGNNPVSPARKLPSKLYVGSMLLERGFNGSLELYEWWQQVLEGNPDMRRDVTITLLDEERNPVARWRFRNAFPNSYSISRLSALDGDPLTETIGLEFDSYTLD